MQFVQHLLVDRDAFVESNKPGLVKSLDILNISWPLDDSLSDLVASIDEHFNNYPDATKKILVFDK